MQCIQRKILAGLFGLATIGVSAESLAAQFSVQVGGTSEFAMPTGTPGGGTAGGSYNFGTRTLAIFVEAREGFAATSAEIRVGSLGAGVTIGTLTELSPGTSQFTGLVSLSPSDEGALFGGFLVFTLTDANGALVGGRVGVEEARDRQGIGVLPSGDNVEIEALQSSPGDEMALTISSFGGDFLGGEVRRGTPAQPGNLLGAVGPSVAGVASTAFELSPTDADALLFGGGFMFASLDFGMGSTLDIPVEPGIGDTLAFPTGQEAGTTSAGFGRFFFDERPNGDFQYFGNLACTVATSVELRQGGFGQAGTLVATLNQDAGGMRFTGSLTLTPAQRSAFQNSGLFLLVRTAAFPAGELRGQLQFVPWMPTAFSRGCVGADGERDLLMTTDAFVCVERDATLAVTGVTPGATVVFMLGFQGEMLPTIDLGTIGLPDCRLLFDPSHFISVPADAGGTARLTFNVPSHFVQLSPPFVVVQAAVESPGANPLGVTTTNGLRLPLN